MASPDLVLPSQKSQDNVVLDNPQQLANYIQTDGQDNPFIFIKYIYVLE